MRPALVILLLASALASSIAGERLRAMAKFEDPLPAAPNPALGKWLGSLGDAGAMGYWLTFLARVGGWMTEAAHDAVAKNGNTVKLTGVFGDAERRAWGKAYLDGINAWAPDFPEPYLYGGVMFYWYAHDRKTADAFLERGFMHGIHRWELPFYIAVYAYRAREPERAAAWIRKAAAFPEAPAIVPLLATKLLGDTGNPREGLAMMTALLEHLPPQMEMFKDTIAGERERLEALVIVNDAAQAYERKHGVRAHLIEQLLEDGVLDADALKPFGGPRAFIFEGDHVAFK